MCLLHNILPINNNVLSTYLSRIQFSYQTFHLNKYTMCESERFVRDLLYSFLYLPRGFKFVLVTGALKQSTNISSSTHLD